MIPATKQVGGPDIPVRPARSAAGFIRGPGTKDLRFQCGGIPCPLTGTEPRVRMHPLFALILYPARRWVDEPHLPELPLYDRVRRGVRTECAALPRLRLDLAAGVRNDGAVERRGQLRSTGSGRDRADP